MSVKDKGRRALETGVIVEALSNAIESHSELSKARSEYDGYSFDYFGASLIEKADKAAEEFISAIETLIDARVEAKLAEKDGE